MNSLWQETSSTTFYPSLKKNINVDVCIIGGGITGLTAAYLLGKRGVSVSLLEKNKICMRSYSKYNWKNY